MAGRKMGQKEVDQRRHGMFIDDGEIRERCGDQADAVIATLDGAATTQKDKGTRPAGARYRPEVEKKLAEISGA